MKTLNRFDRVLWAALLASALGACGPTVKSTVISPTAFEASPVSPGVAVSPPAQAVAAPLPAAEPTDDAAAPVVVADQSMTITAMLGTVNGDPLFVQDILRSVDEDLRRLATVARSRPDFRTQSRDSIARQLKLQIGDMLILRTAKDALGDEEKQRLEMYMSKIRKEILAQYGGSLAEAEHAYKVRNSSLAKELEDKRRRAIVELYMNKVLIPKISITRQMILKFYEQNRKNYQQEAEVDLYTITLPVERFAKANPEPKVAQRLAEEKARQILDRLKNGEDFAQLAEDFSADPKRHDGGHWPHTRKGTLAKEEIETVAFAMAPNTLAQPLVLPGSTPTNGLVVIIKIGAMTPGRVIPFGEVQKEIEKRLRDQQFSSLSSEYYRKLYDKASIEAMDQMVDTAAEVAVARYWKKG